MEGISCVIFYPFFDSKYGRRSFTYVTPIRKMYYVPRSVVRIIDIGKPPSSSGGACLISRMTVKIARPFQWIRADCPWHDNVVDFSQRIASVWVVRSGGCDVAIKSSGHAGRVIA